MSEWYTEETQTRANGTIRMTTLRLTPEGREAFSIGNASIPGPVTVTFSMEGPPIPCRPRRPGIIRRLWRYWIPMLVGWTRKGTG